MKSNRPNLSLEQATDRLSPLASAITNSMAATLVKAMNQPDFIPGTSNATYHILARLTRRTFEFNPEQDNIEEFRAMVDEEADKLDADYIFAHFEGKFSDYPSVNLEVYDWKKKWGILGMSFNYGNGYTPFAWITEDEAKTL